ncbi:MAG: hypothetical protein AAFP26_14355, partial [Planctomycetota bacterium]
EKKKFLSMSLSPSSARGGINEWFQQRNGSARRNIDNVNNANNNQQQQLPWRQRRSVSASSIASEREKEEDEEFEFDRDVRVDSHRMRAFYGVVVGHNFTALSSRISTGGALLKNDFLLIQLLARRPPAASSVVTSPASSRRRFAVHVRFGRVGGRGTRDVCTEAYDFLTLAAARSKFADVFQLRTGHAWTTRIPPTIGDYHVVTMRSATAEPRSHPLPPIGHVSVSESSPEVERFVEFLRIADAAALDAANRKFLVVDDRGLTSTWLGDIDEEQCSRARAILQRLQKRLLRAGGSVANMPAGSKSGDPGEGGGSCDSEVRRLSERFLAAIPHDLTQLTSSPAIDNLRKLERASRLVDVLCDDGDGNG